MTNIEPLPDSGETKRTTNFISKVQSRIDDLGVRLRDIAAMYENEPAAKRSIYERRKQQQQRIAEHVLSALNASPTPSMADSEVLGFLSGVIASHCAASDSLALDIAEARDANQYGVVETLTSQQRGFSTLLMDVAEVTASTDDTLNY